MQAIKVMHKKSSRAKKLKNGINALPLKALSYSLSYVLAYAGKNAASRKIAKHVKTIALGINAKLDSIENGYEISGKELYDTIHSGVLSYIKLYSSLDSSFKENAAKLPKGNIIAIPALMERKGIANDTIANAIAYGLYMKPFEFLGNEIDKLRKLEQIRASFMLSDSNDRHIDIEKLGNIISTVNKVSSNPETDDKIKESIIEDVASNSYVFEYLCSKLEGQMLNASNAKRVLRS